MSGSGSRTGSSAAAAIEVSGVTVRFGGITALSDLSIAVPGATITGLIGPNGAGKSTLLGVLSGFQRPAAGRVFLGGHDVTRASVQARARMGLARTFQHPEIFADLTVREHLVLADRVRHARSRLVTDFFTGRAFRTPDHRERERVDQIIELLGLKEVAGREALGLPLGTSRLVEVARALAATPRVLLLDEPSSGLDRHETERLAAVFAQIARDHQIAVVVVEHDVDMVLRLASIVFVLDFGRCIAAGAPAEIRASPAVRSAYLGELPALPLAGDPASRGESW